jgi:hypothetical protein
MNEPHANGALSCGGGDPLDTPRANVADSEDAMPVCLKEEGHARDWPPRARQVSGGEIRPGLHEPLVVERDAPTEPAVFGWAPIMGNYYSRSTV